jgi:hypothetical protein
MKILRFIFFVLIFYSSHVRAVETIGIEVKEYDNIDAFVLYHPDFFKLEVTYVSGVVKIKTDYPVQFRKLTPVSIDALSRNLKNENSKTISFVAKEPYTSFEVVRGEKLTAIKFRTDKKFEKVNHNIQALNKQDHQVQGLKVEEKEKEQKEEVKISKNKDEIEVKFEFSEDVSSGAFQRSNKVWIAFDRKKGFEFPAGGDIKSPTLIDIPEFTVLSFEIPNGYLPYLNSTSPKHWTLGFRKKESKLRSKYKIEKLLDHYGVHVSSDSLKKIVNFVDPAVGDRISIITTTKPQSGVDSNHFFNDFTLYNTLGGVAVSWVVEDYKIEFSKTGLELYSLNNAIFGDSNSNPQETEVDFSKSFLPVNFKMNGSDLTKNKAYLLKKIINSKNLDEEEENKYNLACFFFSEKLYHEALGTLENIKFQENFLKKFPEAPLFKGALLSLLTRYKDSESIFSVLMNINTNPSLKAEAKIWSNYNKIKLEESTNSIGLLKFIDGFFEKYPDDIYWNILSAEFEVTSNNNDLSIVEQLFRKIRAPKQKIHNDELNFYKATFYRKNKKYNLANNYYDSIKLDSRNAYHYVRGELEQIDMFIKLNQIEPDEAVKKLDKLKFLWRGDHLEYQTLLKTAELRQGNQDYIKALRTYKYLLESFPNNKGSVHISHQMADIYNNFIFSKGGIVERMSDFEIVSLYYEFRELTPIGEAGDRVVLSVAKRMINLDLLDEAERILNHQVQYRLSGKDKILSGEHLAAIYIINKKPRLAIDVLNDTDLVNFGFLEHMTRQRVKSKAYIDLEEYDSALEILDEDESTDAKILKLDAYFKKSDWSNYALIAESDILPLLSVKKKIPENLEKEVLRLAISYSMLGRPDEIAYLNANLNTDDNVLLDSIALISSSNEKIDIRNLDSKFKVDEVDKFFKSVVDKLFDFK